MTFKTEKFNIDISFWFIAVITLLLVLFPESDGAVCFLFCILHELGHLSAMFILKKKTQKISFGYFGIKIVTENKFLPPKKEALIAAAGPLVNLILFAFLYSTNQKNYALISLGLAVFNLLPVSMLDGGHILSAFFPDSKITKKIGIACAAALALLGVAVAVYSKENFTILIVSIYLLIGVICEK